MYFYMLIYVYLYLYIHKPCVERLLFKDLLFLFINLKDRFVDRFIYMKYRYFIYLKFQFRLLIFHSIYGISASYIKFYMKFQ